MSTIGKDTLQQASILHPDWGPSKHGEETITTTTGEWGNNFLSSKNLFSGMGLGLVVNSFMAVGAMYLFMGIMCSYLAVA